LQKSPLPNIDISLPTEDNLSVWQVIIKGPPSTPYSAGKFKLEFNFPSNYPFRPPNITFKTKIYHPNVSTETGQICNEIINWSPTLNVRYCLETLVDMMKNPNADNPLEESIAAVLREKPKEFEKTAIKWAKESNQQSF